MLFCIFCVMVSRAVGLVEASMMYVTLPIFLSVVVTVDCFTVNRKFLLSDRLLKCVSR